MNAAYTIGVAGHVDHGKTTLVRTLTGVDTDRRAEEKARGLSIEAGVAELKLPDGRGAALIDVPGHTDFLKNTIRGLNGIDMAILVIAADDGVMPQTREHLEILKFFKVAAAMVVLTKIDLVDEETLELAELEVSELLNSTLLHNAPIFKFTPTKPELCADILKGIDSALARLPVKKTDRPLRLWIDQVRSIAGHGTVVSGTVSSGKICCNDEIELLPAETKIRVRSLQIHACSVDQAVAGQRVGINLHRVPLGQVLRGMSLSAPGAIRPTYLLNAQIRVLPGAKKGIKNRQKVKVHLGTSMTTAMIVFMNGDRLDPGDCGLVQIRLLRPTAAQPQDAFVISLLNINTVIAGGLVLEIPREKFRIAKTQSVLPLLTALQKTDAEAYVETLFEHTSGSPITAKKLAEKTGWPPAVFERTINSKVQKGELLYLKGHGAIKKSHLSTLEKQFKTVIAEAFVKDPLKKNVALSEVAEHLDCRVDAALLDFIAETLCKNGVIARLDGGYRLTRNEPSLDARQESLVSHVLDYMHASGLTPINPNFFWKQHPSRYSQAKAVRLFNYLYSQKRLIRLDDGRFLSLQALAEIKKRVSQAIMDRGFISLYDCKKLFGYGRTGGAHVLDYLNQIGFTVRQEDKHYLKKDGF
ncbi:MAG: selenocysteine-specific translation elongation factor [Desulfobacteraceae bacterium]|nr:selenocysteine-specific translation elongation factor [Desulfobacteraceae bacterium]